MAKQSMTNRAKTAVLGHAAGITTSVDAHGRAVKVPCQGMRIKRHNLGAHGELYIPSPNGGTKSGVASARRAAKKRKAMRARSKK